VEVGARAVRVDATAVQLRPRPMFEAADLGVRLVQASRGDLLRTAGPLYAVFALGVLALHPIAPWLPMLVLWWAKPWLDRTVLFVLSRSMFRQRTAWADLWAAKRSVWWHGLLASWTTRRLSLWRAFTQPAVQLEGLGGRALAKRCAQLRQGHQGTALGVAWACVHLEYALLLGAPALLLWLVPGGASFAPFEWIFGNGDGNDAGSWLFSITYLLVVAAIEPFYVGAGFAMYINRRVELEAWDVEQALRHAFAPA
jgi:hypothetical protein